MSLASDEIKLRIPPAQKAVLQRAADATGVKVSQFIREAAQARADDVLAAAQLRQVTVLSDDSFDALLEALDAPGRPVSRVAEAAVTLRAVELD